MPTMSRASGVDRSGLKILLIASIRFPLSEPFVGGLETHTWSLAQGLRERGHTVVVAAATGSDPAMVGYEFGSLPPADDRADTSVSPAIRQAEERAFTGLMDDLHSGLLGSFDLIHNNSLYPTPVAQAGTLPCPLVTTLHTPVLPWAPEVFRVDRHREVTFIAVSRATARSWSSLVPAVVVHNGVDPARWPAGPGGPRAVWSGRLVAEKAPHLAIDIARAAGMGLTLAGPIMDQTYFADQVAPRLGGNIRYAGHLGSPELARLVGASAVALVTPTWAEPFGLVAVEAMCCGTPVLAFGRGGLLEVVTATTGRLLSPPRTAAALDPGELAAAVTALAETAALDRAEVRRVAEATWSLSRMVARYEQVYDQALARSTWA